MIRYNFSPFLFYVFAKFWSYSIFCSRIDGSSLSGKIPSFIGNWTKLERLWVYILVHPWPFICWRLNKDISCLSLTKIMFCRDLQGTAMEGPIPPAISLLKSLKELWVLSLPWLWNAMLTRWRFSFDWWNVYITGEYLIWRGTQPWHFLIWKIWNAWWDCELKPFLPCFIRRTS